MEQQLIDKILNGDLNSFEILIDKYQSLIYNLAYRFFLNLHDAEDITQEVFLKIYKNLEKFKKHKNIKTWVYTVTYNTCIDEMRKRKSKNNLSLDAQIKGDENDFSLELKDTSPTPEKIFENKEALKEIENALNSLNEVNKTIIYLRDVKQLSYNEISKITGMSLGTVKSRLNRARNQLNQILQKN